MSETCVCQLCGQHDGRMLSAVVSDVPAAVLQQVHAQARAHRWANLHSGRSFFTTYLQALRTLAALSGKPSSRTVLLHRLLLPLVHG